METEGGALETPIVPKPFKCHMRNNSSNLTNKYAFNWFGTIWCEEDKQKLREMQSEFEYMIISDDDHTKRGQLHWHVYLKGVKRIRGNHFSTINTHWEVARNNQWCVDYCKKKGIGCREYGVFMENGGTNDAWKNFIEECKTKTPRELIEGPYSKLYARYMGFAGTVNTTFRKCEIIQGDLVNEWYWGPRGTGKSRKAWEENPRLYVKPINKWWDGYSGERVVLLDDWDPDIKGMVNYLKIWADRYPFRAEVKGSSMMIRPKKIIVTSNYPIEECFERKEDVEALKRRFRVTQFHERLQQE